MGVSPNWELLLTPSEPSSSQTLRENLLSADFSSTTDVAKLQQVIRLFQRLLAPSSSPHCCPECRKKFRTPEHLSEHLIRRHSPAPAAVGDLTTAVTRELQTTREFLAAEIHAAMRQVLETHTAVPPGVSFAGDLEVSVLSPSPPLSN
jgi:hypothetical protein